MQISRDQVEHVARLSCLTFSEAEIERFRHQLSEILTYVEALKAVNTTGVEPTSHVVRLENVFRADDARPSLPRDQALVNAPDQAEGFFRVPKVIETKEAAGAEEA